MNEIPEEALKTIEESFGTRLVRHTAREADAEEPFASVFPENAAEVESLTKLAARHHIPLVARGAGTAIYPGKPPRGLTVRFDAMRQIRIPEGEEENWVEVEPGVTWWTLEQRLREQGMGPRVYPTSAPRSTVGGWLAENGIGVGSYEYGWLLQNVLSVEAVLAGGERSIIEGGEALRHFVGSRGSMGFVVKAWLTTRRASGDVPVAILFRDAEDLGKAIMDLDRGGAPPWHLGFLNAAMARASRFEIGPVLFGAYPKEREPCRVWSSPIGGISFPRRRLSASGSRDSSRRATWDQSQGRAGRWFEVNVWPRHYWSSSESLREWPSRGACPDGERWRSWLSTRRRGARALLTSPALRTPSWCS